MEQMNQNDLSKINISLMKIQDLDEISNNLEKDFDDFWNYNVFKSELENPNSKYFICKLNNEIVGFAGVVIVLDEADITNIVVKKDFRNKGIGNALLNYLIEFCKSKNLSKINLEVSSNNDIAINLYKKFGFKQVGNRKNYYQNSDGLLFTKTICQ